MVQSDSKIDEVWSEKWRKKREGRDGERKKKEEKIMEHEGFYALILHCYTKYKKLEKNFQKKIWKLILESRKMF